MANISWKSGVNGDWGTATDWTGGKVPGSADAVTIAAAGNYTITVSTAEAANSLVLNASGAELIDTASLTIGTSFTETAGFVVLEAGSITGGKMSIAAGASLSSAGASSMSSALTNNGEIDVSTGTLILSQGGSIAGTLDGSGTLALSGGTFVAVGGASLVGTGYEQLTNSALMTATVTSNSATSTVGSTVSFGIDQGGTLAIAKGATFLDTGTLTLGSTAGAGFVNGPGTLSTTHNANIADAGLNVPAATLSGTLTWMNSGVADVFGYASVGASSTDTVTIINQAGAGFYFIDDDGTLGTGSGGREVFTNAGTLSKTGGTGISSISMVVNSTGVLGAASGTLALTGGGSIAGTVSGLGTVALLTQNYTLGALAGAGTLWIDNGNSATETATASVSAGIIVSDDSTLAIASGKTLTLGGPLTLGNANNNGGTQYGVLSGPGTLTTTGATTIVDDNATNGNATYEAFIGGNITWTNAATGTVTVSGLAELSGSGGTGDGAAIINQGNFTLAGDDAQLLTFATAADNFTNTGTLAKISSVGTSTSTGTSTLGVAINSSGLINAAIGTLKLAAGGSIAGTVSGAGTVQLYASSFTLGGIAGNGTLDIVGTDGGAATSVTETLTATIAPSIIVQDYATLAVAAGKSLTLGGTLTLGVANLNSGFQYGELSGPGTLTTTGATSIVDDVASNGNAAYEAFIGGNITWINAATGTVTVSGLAEFAITGGAGDGASIVNQGNFTFAGNDAQLLDYTAAPDSFSNTGTLAKLSGTGTTSLLAAVTSTGLISAASGTLSLGDGGSIGGTVSGAGVVQLAASNFTLGAIAGTGTLDIFGTNGGASISATETLTATIAPSIIIQDYATLAVAAGKTLTLGGSLTLGVANLNSGFQYGELSGPGTLTTTGATSIVDDIASNGNAAYEAFIGGNITWINAATGTVTVSGLAEFAITGGAGDGASIVNQGNFTFAGNDAQLLDYTAAPDSFSNTGTLAKLSGTGTTSLLAAVTSTGLISAASGTLSLGEGGSIGGTVAGAGIVQLAGANFTLGAIAGSGTLDIFGTNGVASISATETLTTTIAPSIIVQDYASLVVAAGKSLTLGGSLTLGVANLNSGYQYGLLSGPGTLTTTGATTVVDDVASNGNAAYEAFIGGNITWINAATGTVSVAGLAEFAHDGGGSDNASIVNQGNFDFTSNDAQLIPFQAATDNFTNSGTLARTGGTAAGTSVLAVALTSTGAITSGVGTLALELGGTLSGSIGSTGNGVLLLSAAGSPSSTSTYTATGALAITDHAAQASVTAGNGLTIINTGTMSDAGIFALGATTSDSTSFTNAAAGTFLLTGADSGITAKGTATISNAGLIEQTGSGLASIGGTITNTGTIEANSGTLKLANAVAGTGTEQIDAGATLEVNTAPAAQSIVFNGGGGATLKLDHPASRALIGFGAGDRLDLAGVTVSNATVTGTTLTVKTGSTTYTFTSAALAGALPTFGTDNTGGSFVSLYRAGTATHAPDPLAFGNVHVGDKPVLALTVTNTAPADGYSETLDAGLVTTSTGFSASGTVTGIKPQMSDTSSLTATLTAANAGAKSGTATLTLASDGSGVDGRGSTPLASQTIMLTGAVYNYAAASLPSNAITLANHHVGDTDTTLLTVTNSAPAGNYSEALDASFGATTGAATASGSLAGLAAGNSNSSSLTLGLLATTAGAISGSVVLTPTSDGNGIDGLGTTTLGTQQINLTGGVYAYAAGTLSSSTINLGIIHASTAASAALTVTNGAPTGGYSESLDAGLSGGSAVLSTSGSITGLAAGSTDSSSLQVIVNDPTSGAYSGSATLGLVSDGAGTSGLGTTTLTSQTVTVTATVDNYAVAALEDPSGPALTGTSTNETLNLGTAMQGASALTASIGALNAATGTADLLGGTFASAGASGFTNSGLGTFTGLSAGQDEHAQSVSLSTSSAGTFTETIVLSSYGTNASGYIGALTPETLTVTGTITPSAATTYTLAIGPNVIHGADGMGDIFIASAGALNSRDQLTGGNGANSVTLKGGGLFDVNAPTVFANIPTLNATEGQSASGTLADTTQTILLRDGGTETLNVAAGKAATGNANPETINIYGGTGTDTINLAGGTDQVFLGTGAETVTLGSAKNAVTGGGGTALVHSTAAFAGAAVVGTSSAFTTLDITTAGGAIALNAADTYLTVQLDAASTLKLSAMSFITAIGSFGADKITALAGTQTLTGGAGVDTLTGYTGGHDTFADTAAGLNGDTIGNWTTGDIIDLTNIQNAGLHPLTFSGTTLTVTDGTHTAAIKFTGTQALHNFTVLGTDQSGGTLIGYHT